LSMAEDWWLRTYLMYWGAVESRLHAMTTAGSADGFRF
jgi:hypothetical protein